MQAAHAEPGEDPAATAADLAAELRDMATWLGLERVRVADRGDLAPALAAELGARGPSGPPAPGARPARRGGRA